MSARLLTADLFNEIDHFFPEVERSPQCGRRRASNRTVLYLYFFRAQDRHCLGRPTPGIGLLAQDMQATDEGPEPTRHLEMADVLVDAGLIKAPLGGQNVAPTRPIEAKLVAS